MAVASWQLPVGIASGTNFGIVTFVARIPAKALSFRRDDVLADKPAAAGGIPPCGMLSLSRASPRAP